MAVGESLAVAAAKSVLDKAAPGLLATISNRIGRSFDQVKVQFTRTFQTHISNSLKRSRHIKTVVSKDKAVDLDSIYVSLTMTSGSRTDIPDSEVSPVSRAGLRAVVSGTGGSGKTVLMKHLLNISTENQMGLVPLYFELRTLDLANSASFSEALYLDMKLKGAEESSRLFHVGLENGIFALYLDGFDEIKPDWQAVALKRIDEFGRQYDLCSIVITTRPKTGAEDLPDFDTYHVNPLSKEQALLVVQRTPFEKVTKDKFYAALQDVLYDKHQTMMSIPILVAMMLLTFRSYSDIPDRMTVFYAQAYNTLFAIHDSEGKLQFKREYRSQLAPDLFKSVLEAFCFLSLRNHDIEFTHNSFYDYVGKAIKLSRVNCAVEDYAKDLIQNVCILQPDGVSYVFVHRSFQEYFAASYALNYSGESPYRIMDQISDPHSGTSALMMREMNDPKFQRLWLLPKLEYLLSKFEEVKDSPMYVRLGKVFSSFGVKDGRVRSIGFTHTSNKMYDELHSVNRFCENISLNSMFLDDIIPEPAETALLSLSKDPESGVTTRTMSSIGESFLVELGVNNEHWLQTTGLKMMLDKHLDALRAAYTSVKEFVEKQDDLEAELLGA
jgi:hypothetical protein